MELACVARHPNDDVRLSVEANQLPDRRRAGPWLITWPPSSSPASSAAFAEGGFYVLRNDEDHIFVDCGPLGLGGRGGHGHNDLLSFEAVIAGVHLVTDCGAYLYTADYRERNAFRSTAYHNTPRVDGEEINRFVRPDYLWFLHDDAEFEVETCEFGAERDRLAMRHTGYCRLPDPVLVARTLTLDHREHMLAIEDRFEGEGDHDVEIPLHLAAGVGAAIGDGDIELRAQGRRFILDWAPREDWEVGEAAARVSPSYGVAVAISRLCWRRRGRLRPLRITIRSAVR